MASNERNTPDVQNQPVVHENKVIVNSAKGM